MRLRSTALRTEIPASPRAARRVVRLVFALLAGLLLVTESRAQVTAFTYQGRLTVGGQPATGLYDFRFLLANTELTGGAVGQPILLEEIPVTNGVFTVALDFGLGAFDGAARWLEIAVRSGTNTGLHTVLSPRQLVTSVPYAMRAAVASQVQGTGIITLSMLDNSVLAKFQQLTALSDSLAALSNRTETNILSAGTFVSSNPADPLLLARGLRGVVTVAAPAWVNGSFTAVPSARSAHTAVWTGQEMVVWGGTLGAGLYSGVGAWYRPELDTWQGVSPVSAPSARAGHTAVWTGSEMLVWGGFSGSSYLNTGGRFSVPNQLWTSVTTTDAPAVRDAHVAVWTGSRMVVWGGRNSTGLLADGALYSPTNNTWTTLPLFNAPAPRMGATVVWTGDRMLVWGGEGTNSYLNTGGQLLCPNGVPSEWWSTSPFGTPTARSGHTAVWTGSRMLVWGGLRLGTYLSDGAAYNPLTGSWTPLALTNAPTARTLHNAVWTGAEMVIFGGETASGTVASGGAYDPTTDTWRVLGNPGSPQARSESTAAWTGSEALFFGGRNEGSPLAALQRLTPQPAWYFFRKP